MKRRAPVIMRRSRGTAAPGAAFRDPGRRVNHRVVGFRRISEHSDLAAMARILLAEDDDQMRAFLNRGLRRAGHAVDAVGDGEAALERSRDAEYDLLLADIVMPGIDGIELARRVTARQPGIRVMFITGFAAVALQDDRIAPHRPRIVAKPFHLRHLIAEIEALLAQ
jgi:two-component system cell cycle response regulator CpdR